MSLLIKICGLSTPAALDTALEAGADMGGFVFFAPSPRHLGLEAARGLRERVGGRAQKGALTVGATADQIARVIEALQPGGLQLHRPRRPGRGGGVRIRV